MDRDDRTGCDGNCDDSVDSCHQNLVKKVFGNDVIVDNLLSYLELKDFKNLRLTSGIFGRIWRNKQFLKRAVISGFDSEAVTSGIKWKNLRIHLNINIKEKETLTNLLEKDVEFLWLTGNGVHLKEFVRECPGNTKKAAFERLNHLKTNTTTLNGFRIQDFPFLADNLTNLNLHLNVKCAKLEEMPLLFNNLSFIAERCRKLTEFKLTYYNFRNPDITWKEVQKWRMRTLEANAKNISAIGLEATSDIDQLAGVTFPSLKHCTLRGHWTLSTAIFLKNQPFLESFQFDCWRGHSPVAVLQTVAEVSKSFKKLVINASGFNAGENTDASPWAFLSRLNFLENIQVVESSENDNGIYAHLWPNFPASLKSIHMTSVKRLSEQPNISTLSNFPFRCLTELELFSGNQIEDTDLQQICTKLSKLEVLKFSWCSRVTDYGITGIPLLESNQNPSEVTINRLKELRKLTINHCERLTNFIGISLCFQFLTELDLRENTSLQATLSFKEKLWSQNPRLELLHV